MQRMDVHSDDFALTGILVMEARWKNLIWRKQKGKKDNWKVDLFQEDLVKYLCQKRVIVYNNHCLKEDDIELERKQIQ